MIDYLKLPTEDVPASAITVDDVLIHHGRAGDRPVRVLRVKRLSFRPSPTRNLPGGNPTVADQIVLLVRPVGKRISEGFTALRPAALDATFTRVVE